MAQCFLQNVPWLPIFLRILCHGPNGKDVADTVPYSYNVIANKPAEHDYADFSIFLCYCIVLCPGVPKPGEMGDISPQ